MELNVHTICGPRRISTWAVGALKIEERHRGRRSMNPWCKKFIAVCFYTMLFAQIQSIWTMLRNTFSQRKSAVYINFHQVFLQNIFQGMLSSHKPLFLTGGGCFPASGVECSKGKKSQEPSVQGVSHVPLSTHSPLSPQGWGVCPGVSHASSDCSHILAPAWLHIMFVFFQDVENICVIN